MSLCRWSHSPFYIYEEAGGLENEIKVQFEGYFTSNEILTNPIRNVYMRARSGGYSISASIELLIWLYPWAMCNKNTLSVNKYHKILEFTRFLSYVRSYIEGDYKTNFQWITMRIEDCIWEIEKFVVNDPIHKLPWEEKRKIYEEAGFLKRRK